MGRTSEAIATIIFGRNVQYAGLVRWKGEHRTKHFNHRYCNHRYRRWIIGELDTAQRTVI